MRRNSIVLALGALFLILVGFWAFGLNRGGNDNPDKLDDATASARSSAAAKADDPGKRCATQQTYALVERELFRQAAATRGSDADAFGQLANEAAVRVQNPVLKRRDDGLDTIVCGGRVSIDLPPGIAVVGGRHSLSADVDYALQPSADGTGQVVTLSNADGIVVPLATLGRFGAETAPASSTNTTEVSPPPLPPVQAAPASTDNRPRVPATPPPAAPTPPPIVRADPSFDCRYSRNAGERAVCGDASLSAMDRQMSAQYARALRNVDPDGRQLLVSTGRRFLAFRNACPNNACIAQAYSGRMREIDDIVNGRWSDR